MLEVNATHVTVLTPDGEFLKGRKVRENYEVGEEIDFFPLNERASFKKTPYFSFGKLRIALASSIAAILLFFTAFSYYDSHQVYAYMSIDINPSIEAAVDKKLRVITLKAYNQEGRAIIANLEEWKNHSIESVTESIIKDSRESGYYKEGAEVIIATVVVDDEGDVLKEKLTKNVSAIAKAHKAENVKITVLDRGIQDRELAIGKGLSTGKYVKEFIMATKDEEQKESNKETEAKDKPVEQPVKPVDKENEVVEKQKEELPKVQMQEKNNDAKANQQKATEQKQEKKTEHVKEKLKEVKEKIKNKKEDRDDDREEDDDDDDDEKGKDRDEDDDDEEDDD